MRHFLISRRKKGGTELKKRIIAFLTALVIMTVGLSTAALASDDNYKTWLQTDSRWGSIGFGYNDSYTVARVGCALTSVAKVMAYSGAVSQDTSVFNPGVLCNYLKANGGFTSSGDIYWAKPCEYASGFTLEKWTNVSGSREEKISQIKSFLDSGCMVVCSVKYYGHYVAVEKVENGKVYIMDPASNDITDLFYYDEAGVGANVIVYKGPHGAGNGGNNGGGGYTAGRYSIKSSDGVNLRSGPSTDYERIGWIANGAEVEVSVVSGEWGKISYNGADGWICLKYTNKIADRVYTLSMEIISLPYKTEYMQDESFDGSGLVIRMNYSDGTSELFSSGFDLSGYSSSPGVHTITVSMWGFSVTFEVRVKSSQVCRLGIYSVRSSNGINVRSQPSTDSEVIGGLSNGVEALVYEVAGNWGKIDYNGQQGYICLDYADRRDDSRPLGDADGDGYISVNDALMLLQYAVRARAASDLNISCADVDGDGAVTPSDALITLQIAVGVR